MRALKALLSILVVIGVVLAVFLFLLPYDKKIELDILLADADRALESGSYSAAESYIREGMGKAYDQMIWLRILKRAYYCSKYSQNPTLFYDAAHSAAKKLPGNEVIQAMSVVSSLMNRKYTEARITAEEFLHAPDFNLIKAEAVLSDQMESTGEISGKQSPMDALAEKLKLEKDPQLYQDVAEKLGEPRLNMDAAYMWMQRGEIDLARNNMLNVPEHKRNHEAAAYIAMDAGQNKEAMQELEKALQESYDSGAPRWDLAIILGDQYLRVQKWNNAIQYYNTALDNVPGISSHPYMSLAYIYRSTGKIRTIIPVLEAARSQFSDDEMSADLRPITLALADYYNARGDYVPAEEVLNSYLDRNPHDAEVALFQLDMQTGHNASSARREARLWEIYSLDEKNDDVAQYLAWFLMGKADYPGVNLLLDRHSSRLGGDSPLWHRYYRAVMYALQEKYDTSLTLFLDDYEATGRWESLYNAALIKMYLNDNRTALEYLDNAYQRLMIVLPLSSERDKNEANIMALRAQILFGMNQNDEASELVREILELDPDNRKAQSLKRLLNSGN